jgi:hypothetical protein
MIIYLAGASWDAVTGTDRHLATALGRRVPVLWVDPPMSWLAKRRRGLTVPRLSSPAAGVTRLHTVSPPGVGRPGIRVVARWMMQVKLRRVVKASGVSPTGVICSSPEPVLRGWRQLTRFYYVTDDFVAGAQLLGFSARHARRSLQSNMDHADHVFAVSPALVDRPGSRKCPYSRTDVFRNTTKMWTTASLQPT